MIKIQQKIQKVFGGSKARRETEQMKNEIIQNEQADEENTDQPDENKSVTKNQKGKGLPVRRIKKGSLKGSQVHREAKEMIKTISNIKYNLDQKLSASELKDNETNENKNESAKKHSKSIPRK